MGVKLMTGATGEQNIQAADDRECLAGITGLDSYVFPTGSKLKATLVDANTVTIGTGAGSLQGSRFRCSTTTTVTIQSGTQGQFRRDVIGLHFKRESSGRESMEFQVLTGDPASSDGAASDPSYAEGDLLAGDAEAFMPLYRVKLSGINAADPEPLFSVLTPLADLGDSVSRRKVACGSVVIHKGANYFWDMMSFEEAARHLGCSVSDFHVEDTGVGNLLCFVCSGDSTNWIGPMVAEFDPGRSQIRLRFTNTESHVFRANWMLVLDMKP